jgi:hypothetical protein
MKAYPGLTEAESEISSKRIGKTRCGKCPACQLVEATRKIVTPNPPFNHTSDSSVVMWNRVLFSNPCIEWGAE